MADFMNKDLNVQADTSSIAYVQAKYDEAIAKLANTPLTYGLADGLRVSIDEMHETINNDEEWIWVEGYKATDKDMKCRDYQYELNKKYDMPEDSKIRTCHSGFHLCLKLEDVFGYYELGKGNRFFKVSALVRKNDKKYYRSRSETAGRFFLGTDKLAAKSIIFTKELTPDEIFKDTEYAEYDEEFKKIALETSLIQATKTYQVNKLVSFGYSEPLAKKIINRDSCGENMFELACALETQPGISMDTKIIALMAY